MITPLELTGGGAGTFRFAWPWALLALALLPPLFLWMRRRERKRLPTLRFPGIPQLKRAMRGQSIRWRGVLDAMRLVIIALLIIASARPQYGRIERQTYSEGIDIGLVLDVSLSMRTDDFQPNRLEAAKEVVKQFIDDRQGDRLSLTIFGSEAVNLVPLTLDYGVVRSFIERVRFNIVDGNTTAIGMGLATALTKLRNSKAKSKVIILLTDGENNAGKIDPLKAAEAAKAVGVRVYTIGVGSDTPQMNPFGFRMPMQSAGIDEPTLKQMAGLTGGLYFRATDNAKLHEIYKQIDKLEKSRVESTQFDNFNDLVYLFALPALLLLMLEIILRATRFLTVP
ncbi:MAG: VWA domain-containing protein [Candidatus Sumerlaeaceae bacterium]